MLTSEFHMVQHTTGYNMCAAAWGEQRDFVDLALEALGTHPLANQVHRYHSMFHVAFPRTSLAIKNQDISSSFASTIGMS